MGRFIWSQLRHRFGRAAALLLGIVVATTSFTVLTATSRTSQLRTTATVGEHFRVAYDILVRPKGTQSAVEAKTGTVQPNFLSGIYGGITAKQWHSIEKIPGVDVAAPIAMVGTVLPTTSLNYSLKPYLTGSDRQMFRIKTTWVSDRGLTRVPEVAGYVYLTKNALENLGTNGFTEDGAGAAEVLPDGTKVRTCPGLASDFETGYAANDPFGPAARGGTVPGCISLQTGPGGLGTAGSTGATEPMGGVSYSIPLLLAGVDPVSEARLAHLDQAVVSGRYLRPNDAASTAAVPVLSSTSSGVDDTVNITIERMPDPTAPPALQPFLAVSPYAAVPGVTLGTVSYSAQDLYAGLQRQLAGGGAVAEQRQDGFWQSGPTDYTSGPGGTLVPAERDNGPQTWASGNQGSGVVDAPIDNTDTGYRTLLAHPWTNLEKKGAYFSSVGVFDPSKLPAFDPLSDVDLGLYSPISATPGDAAARTALHNQNLLPNENLAGHLRQPPQLITTLDGLAPFYGSTYDGAKPAADPISVIRVRVGGVVGPDAVSRERVNQVAQQISVQTGLQVDLVVGSSTAPTLVRLPAGRFGRPELLLSEGWVKKNVAVTILQAVNRKSLVLFVLILAVCALFVANGTSAAVRTRRIELGVLACLGWSRGRLYTAVLTEVLLVGAVAGTAGGLLAVPLGRVLGLTVSTSRAVLAVPAAVGLALLAGLVPAWRASRADPGAAVRPAVSTGRRTRRPRGVAGLALTNVMRTPGRSLLAALSLAVGAAALTLLVGITQAFRGVVVGSLLGDAVAVQVRGVDYIAVIATVALGVLAVADVLFLNIRERAAELATLRATGWPETALSRLVVVEGALLGLVGALVGAAVGLVGVAAFAGDLPGRLVLIGALVLAGGIAVTALAALVPVQLLRRLSTAPLLAED